ncbi:MAG: glutathione S-transferase family protein [Alphaproteobacteria bacterium]|jgi:putative glutathione S-transferase|nr:glutathione S-transferase family protein [Alphaproteobacteria bacterium]
MGIMVQGKWRIEDFAERNTKGSYNRATTSFRNWIGDNDFPAEAGRYHLVVAHACPWAHRTLILRALKGLEAVISVAFAEPLMLDNGWVLADGGDPVTGAQYAHQVYAQAAADYSGRCSVPIFWDKQSKTIVSNESSEIIRMLNTAFDHLATKSLPDLYPEDLRADIDAVNGVVYENINNGVYRTGFATSQEAYEASYNKLFGALDEMEARLENRRYLTGPRITEADWRLFATLVRFDAVYVGHFKCNRQRIADYPNLSNYLRELYQWPGIAETVDIPRTKQHYYGSHLAINPFGVVPSGPKLNFDAPHDRGRLPGA